MKKSIFTIFIVFYSLMANAQWTTNGSGDAVNNNSSGKVGIGTTPLETLHINGNIRGNVSGALRISSGNGYIDVGAQNSSWAHIYTDRPYFIFNQSVWSIPGGFSSYSTADLSLQTNGTTRMTISNSNGYVGIGTASTPASKLHISSGNARETLRVYLDGNTANYLNMWQGTGGAVIDPIGTGLLLLGYDMTTTVSMNGKLGIGTSSPEQKLDVRGNLVLEAGGNPSLFTGTGTSELSRYLYLLNSSSLASASGLKAGGILVSDTYSFANPSKNDLIVKGNVGIGITAAQAKFHVVNGSQGFKLLTGTNTSGYDLSIGVNDDGINFSNSSAIRGFNFSNASGGLLTIASGGNVGIGTSSPDAKLAVSGQVHAQEVKVSVTVPGPDYVFEKDYKLSSLEEIKNYIDQNKHLPEVPSAKEMEKNGVQLGEMNMLLLKKIEELTLHLIELKKENTELKEYKNQIVQLRMDLNKLMSASK